jgi:Fe-S-cluster containining protein
MSRITEADLEKLEAIHREVDGLAAMVAERLGERLVCRSGCCDCCQDRLTVLEIEAELIKARCGELLSVADPAPPGACAFLDGAGACRIYRWRPYVCRTQGLPLRWFEDDAQTSEGRDICPLNLEVISGMGEDLAEYPAENCWTLGPWEGRLASLQAEASGRFEQTRVLLRSLFPARNS